MITFKTLFHKKPKRQEIISDDFEKLNRRFEEITGFKVQKNNLVEFKESQRREKAFSTNFTVKFDKNMQAENSRAALVMAYVTHAIGAIEAFEENKYSALLEHTNSKNIDDLIKNVNRDYRAHGQNIYKLSNMSRKDLKMVMGDAPDLLVVPKILMLNSMNLAFSHLFTADYIKNGNKKQVYRMLENAMQINSSRMKNNEIVRSFILMVEARNSKDLIGDYYAKYAQVHNIADSEVVDMVQLNLGWGILKLLLEVDMKTSTSLINMAKMMSSDYNQIVEKLCDYSYKYKELP